ncbi:MAG: energy transducer TonB [Dysgonamonadaceae bacterium]|jgi:TonB family protein|nr:energy transducer TonB [Dysgonamonadaceae bacterium]
MKLTKEQIYGFGSSTVLCLLILLLLSFIFLKTEMRAEAEGIPVDFGALEWASGTDEPAPSEKDREIPSAEPVPEIGSLPTPPAPTPPVITQNTEQTAAIEAEKQRREQEKRAEQERQETERKRREEEQRRREAINRQMSGAFGAGNTPEGNQGTATSGAGNQGSPQGNDASGAQTGAGGVGSFDLSGRSLRGGGLQRPAYDVQEEGSIVVEITVNPQGDVVRAEIRLRGTTIENGNMRRSAVEAAEKTKFNGIGGTQNQIGTITYRYTLK